MVSSTQTANYLPPSDANQLMLQGAQHIENRQFELARQAFQAALELYQQQQASRGIMAALYNLGYTYRCLDQLQNSVICYQEAYYLAQRLGESPIFFANLLKNLALVYHAKGDFQHALVGFQKALPLYRQIGDRPAEAEVALSMGISYQCLNQLPLANQCYGHALHIAQTLPDPALEAKIQYAIRTAQEAK